MRSQISRHFPLLVLTTTLLVVLLTSEAQAAGAAPKPPTPTAPKEPSTVQARPARVIKLRPVLTNSFTLPNRESVNLQPELDAILKTIAVSSTEWIPEENPTPPPSACDRSLEVLANLTTVELNVLEFGFSFGYTPNGGLGPVTEIGGDVDVQIGTVAMDFSVLECEPSGRCLTKGAVMANQTTAGAQGQFGINFGLIRTGPSFVYNTPIGTLFRKIISDGLKRLADQSRIHELLWRARVTEVSADGSTVAFDRGTEERIGLNQAFVVYRPLSSQDACESLMAIADLKTVETHPAHTVAKVTRSLNQKPIEPGDLVLIRNLAKGN